MASQTSAQVQTITAQASNRADIRSLRAAFGSAASIVDGEGLTVQVAYEPSLVSDGALAQTIRNLGLYVLK